MSVAAIITRLKALSELADVEQPSRINPLERDRYPVATVYPNKEQPLGSESSLSSATRMQRSYLIVITVDSATKLEAIRDAVVSHLAGWKPAAGMTPLQYEAGETQQLNGSLIQWAMLFSTAVCYG